MTDLQTLIDASFADAKRSSEDLVAGFVVTNNLFQRAPDPGQVLAPNKTRSQELAGQATGLLTAIGASQVDQQAGRTLTEAQKATALMRLSFTFSALHNDYVVPEAAERARLLALLFTHGMDDFTSADFTTLPTKLGVVVEQVQDPKNKVPKVIASKVVADLTPFTDVRAEQVALMQATDEARGKLRALLPLLLAQLTRTLHALCFANEDNLGVVAAYFAGQFGQPRTTAHPGVHAGQVARTRTNQVTNLAAAPARYVRLSLKVDEERALLFYRTDDPKAPAPADALEVSKATPLTLALADVPGTGALLVVRNDTAYVGHYVAELLTA